MGHIYAWLNLNIGDMAVTDDLPTVEGRLVEMYHREADEESKARVLRRALGDANLRCVVAIVSFGIGVNIRDVDIVINWGPPCDVLTSWQELARCAWDGREGRAIIYRYPHSFVKVWTKDDLCDLPTEIDNNPSMCLRNTLLEHMMVGGISNTEATLKILYKVLFWLPPTPQPTHEQRFNDVVMTYLNSNMVHFGSNTFVIRVFGVSQ